MANVPRKPLSPAKLLCIVVGAVFLLILTAVGLLLLPIWDIEEPSFPALERPPRPVVADEDNAYPLLLGLKDVFKAPPKELMDLLAPSADAPSEEELRQLKDYLDSQAPVLATLRQALARPYLLSPEVEDYKQLVPHVTPYMEIGGKLLGLRVYQALQEGDSQGALDTIRLQKQLANAILERPETLLEHLVGIAISSMALENAWRMLGAEGMEDSLPDDLATGFPTPARLFNSLRLALLCEYRYQQMIVNQLVHGEDPFIEMLGAGMVDDLPYLPKGPNAFFQPNRTLQLFAANTEWHLKKADLLDAHDFSPLPPLDEPTQPSLFPPDMGNAVGKVLYQVLVPGFDSVTNKVVQRIAEQDLLRLWLALRRYERQQGHFPDSLDALVPDFLDAIPLDPFDGKPLRYDAARKRIWSLGPDGRDDGGKPPQRSIDERGDIVFGAEGRILKAKDSKTSNPPTVE